MPRPEPVLDISHVAPIRASVRDAIVLVAERLQATPEVAFTDLCEGASGRIDVVVRFLALLELFKAGAVDIDQVHRFSDIRARWLGTAEGDLATLADGIEEYAIEQEGVE